MARLELWRYVRHTPSAFLIAGAGMAILIGAAVLLRRWAWRFTASERESIGTAA
jgi:hypothetical protein